MKSQSAAPGALPQNDSFASRHIGPSIQETQEMLAFLGLSDLEKLSDSAVPKAIRTTKALDLAPAASEHEALAELRAISKKNETWRSYIGLGYSGCLVPPVIQRNVLENPGWYTQYTPYQAEIAQGRLEALLNFQTMVMDLTAMEIANASLLDEATAAAEAMAMSLAIKGKDQKRTFFVSDECYPQTIEVVRTRAEALGITVQVGNAEAAQFGPEVFGVLLQYPTGHGVVADARAIVDRAHAADALVTMACDILALTILTPPGELGADIAVGSTQRFGIPLGFGGPHAAYFATRDAYKRQAPGRLVGVSQDVDGKKAVRLALQTREQHIRRDKATSNICTAQVLLANMAGFYAVYHGPEGLKRIARKVLASTEGLRTALRELGYAVGTKPVFDTIQVGLGSIKADAVAAAARKRKINLRPADAQGICVSLDESVNMTDLQDLVDLFAEAAGKPAPRAKLVEGDLGAHARKGEILTHPVFNTHRSETEMLRYLRKLESKDLSLTHSMIPLGSCTMKLNATAEMFPVSWPEFAWIHPFAPKEQTTGYLEMITQLERMLCEVTGFAAFSLQPNAGSQGEYAGLLVIRRYHESRGDKARNVCLIPRSAHGTNPASAAMAGMKVVVVECDSQGNIDLSDLKAKAAEHAKDLSALMVTYPSTHGVFEEHIREVCQVVHQYGGQVYMDGANMNAQIGLCRPGEFGPDVCHLNLHKTFCIPHGGGGPGMGPIGVGKHLAPFLPGHPLVKTGGEKAIGPISAAPWGSASILPISWMYIRMMGAEGLTRATQIAILNANYIAKKLAPHYPLLFRGERGLVAHECILDLRQFKETAGIEVEDVAKRLMDYGYHAPTVSFPVAGTVMIEPTESESKRELDRFCDAMIKIRQEIAEIEAGKAARDNNVLKNAPHTAEQVTRTEWTRPYARELAAFPAAWVREHKFWPAVGRINAVLGDRNFICACPPIEDYE